MSIEKTFLLALLSVLLCHPAMGAPPTGRANPFGPLVRPKAPTLPEPSSFPVLRPELHALPEAAEDRPKLLGIISDGQEAVAAVQLGYQPIDFLKSRHRKKPLELLSFGPKGVTLSLKGKVFHLKLSDK